MKKLIFSALSLVLTVVIFTSCDKKYTDLMTADAKTGGLVVPAGSIAYLLGATPSLSVALTVPKGPGITSIEVYNKYLRRADTTLSNSVLIKTLDISSANTTADVVADFNINYADLSKDILVGGAALPADENLLPIGDTWEFTYISVMADGRRVKNSSTTGIDVSNRWAASYLLSGYVLRSDPFDPVLSGAYHNIPWKLATGSVVGGIGPWVLTMDDSAGPNNPMPVKVTDALNAAVKNNPAYNSRYVPATKTFYISVFWGTGPTNRAATDTLVYSGPF